MEEKSRIGVSNKDCIFSQSLLLSLLFLWAVERQIILENAQLNQLLHTVRGESRSNIHYIKNNRMSTKDEQCSMAVMNHRFKNGEGIK